MMTNDKLPERVWVTEFLDDQLPSVVIADWRTPHVRNTEPGDFVAIRPHRKVAYVPERHDLAGAASSPHEGLFTWYTVERLRTLETVPPWMDNERVMKVSDHQRIIGKSEARAPAPAPPSAAAPRCDYRNSDCASEGVTVQGGWVCKNHLGRVSDTLSGGGRSVTNPEHESATSRTSERSLRPTPSASALDAARDLADGGYFRFEDEHDDADYRQTVVETAAAVITKHLGATPSVPSAVHVDFVFDGMDCCKVCGLVRPAQGWSRPCKGPVELSLRGSGEVEEQR